MADGSVSQIRLPNGSIYDIVGKEAAIESTYDSTTHTVTLTVGTLTDADTIDY